MTQIVFTEKEARRLHILKEVIEKKITQIEGANQLGIGDRQMRRLQQDYELLGDECVIHGLKGRGSNFERHDVKIIKEIVSEEKFKEFGPTLMQEHLAQDYGIVACTETVRQVMIKSHKREAKSKKNYIYRSERERRSTYGMMIQFDGSYHKWFEDRSEECCLLVAIDDATSKIYAMFCDNEGFECISRFWLQYIVKYGVPETIYLDKFSTYKVNHPKAVREKGMITNFERIMNKLGCRLIFAHSPQAKGRVERCNKTLQDRLVKEMRLRHISDIVCGNIYLQQDFIPWFNENLGVNAFQEGDSHIKNQHNASELKIMFSRISVRSLAQDYIIQYKNRFFQTLAGDYKIYPKKTIEVHETYDGKLYLKIGEKFVDHVELDQKSTRLQRAKYRAQIQKTKKEKQKIDFENLQKTRYEASKKRQRHQKALDLLSSRP